MFENLKISMKKNQRIRGKMNLFFNCKLLHSIQISLNIILKNKKSNTVILVCNLSVILKIGNAGGRSVFGAKYRV